MTNNTSSDVFHTESKDNGISAREQFSNSAALSYINKRENNISKLAYILGVY